MSFWPKWEENKPFALLLILILTYSLVLMGLKMRTEIMKSDQIGRPEPIEHTIYVEAQGKVDVIPDTATLWLTVETPSETVSEAQQKNTETMNNIIAEIKALDIQDKDIKTENYNVYEDQRWNPETFEYDSVGWIVSQQIVVTVRDTEKVSAILVIAGENGITNTSGPSFTLDDPKIFEDQARLKAITEAKQKASVLAKNLGVKIVGISSYSEYINPPMPYGKGYYGIGGAVEAAEVPMPMIEEGSQEVQINVSITYIIE